ncbi:MAG: hypothetical protein SWJ54_19795 [Cyanobacteriota bacterium]|nr:hypothetical protein [Cyanobacteriota bacterium]
MTTLSTKDLIIDSKDSCYVIDQGQMENDLQAKTAKSITLEQGTYSVKIEKGWYSYSSGSDKGEPLVVLWIYGHDNAPFKNHNTGSEAGTTWTILNGFNDVLTLGIKSNQKATVCALFLDVDARQSHGGEVEVSFTQVTSQIQRRLNVKSQNNCWKLNQGQLNNIKRYDQNFIELKPGDYKIKVKQANISYWEQQDEKFKLEPWAILWINGGKFITKYPAQDDKYAVSESWCSLNGYNEELNLKVLEKTTLFGLFFDTYKEDNHGQVILEIRETKLPDSRTVSTPVSASTPPSPPASTTATSTPVSTFKSTSTPASVPSSILPTFISDKIWEMRDQRDIVCVTPVRTIVRREEEITLIRKVRKVEEIDASPACPINTNQISPPQQEP